MRNAFLLLRFPKRPGEGQRERAPHLLAGEEPPEEEGSVVIICKRQEVLLTCLFSLLDYTLKMFSTESKMLQRSISFSDMVSSFSFPIMIEIHVALGFIHTHIVTFCFSQKQLFIPV